MRAVILGSAAGGGFPQWNCACTNCALAWQRDLRAPWRTQSALAVVSEGGAVVVDASPDLGQQIRATPALWPQKSRHSPITTVVLTSAEIDHVAGLSYLREGHSFDLIALGPVRTAIHGNPMFAPLRARWIEAQSNVLLPNGDGFGLTLFAVPGKVPLYLEDAALRLDSADGETSGVLIQGRATRLLYIPGCATLTEDVRDKAAFADVVLFDGTLFDDEEMRRGGLGQKTGRRMGHMPMTGVGGSLDWLASLSARRKIYTHLNNSNPALIEGTRERRLIESAGVEIAYDGLEIDL
jgi:pyrroloquinoline quinone biosynthesis protein B